MTSPSLWETQTPTSATPDIYSQLSLQPIWGRLYSRAKALDSYDLSSTCFKLGRDKSSDIVITSGTLPESNLINVSKTHFEITKEPGLPAKIKDYSKNGTFINGLLVGRNSSVILQNDDDIAIGLKGMIVFTYKTIQSAESNYLPVPLRCLYEISKEIGKGACGEVRLAFDKFTCKPYAIKKIVKAKNPKENRMNQPSKIRNEVNILEKMDHPFVISMKDIVDTEEAVFIVLEYLEGGELTKYIHRGLTEAQTKFLFYQIALGMEYLHNQGVIHRDLKPANILLKDGDADSLLKITDFGLSKIIGESSAVQTICGTLSYVAPEVFDSKRIGSYGQPADVWSLGVILYYMLAKELPFVGHDRPALIRKISTGKFSTSTMRWQKISENAKDLLKKMLTICPKQRITMSNVVAHPWLTEDFEINDRVIDLYNSNKETRILCSSDDFDYEETSKRIKLGDEYETI